MYAQEQHKNVQSTCTVAEKSVGREILPMPRIPKKKSVVRYFCVVIPNCFPHFLCLHSLLHALFQEKLGTQRLSEPGNYELCRWKIEAARG